MYFNLNDRPTRPVSGGPILDMTPDGAFRGQRPVVPLGYRVGAVAFIVAAALAWIAFRLQLWRARRAGGMGRPPVA
jgi:hypothetical protein